MDPLTICGVRWVHVFEEDTPEGAVYRPDTTQVPLSRRPREALTLHEDGSAAIETGGPDDRSVRHPARWRLTGQELVVTPARRGGTTRPTLHITAWSPDSLVVASKDR